MANAHVRAPRRFVGPELTKLVSGSLGEFEHTLAALDSMAASSPPHLAARAFASIAECLALRAGTSGGLRSGPAGNLQWAPALRLVAEQKVPEAVTSLAAMRSKWLASGMPTLMVGAL